MMKDLILENNDVDPQLPLVSVVVISYNSSRTIIETLESIKNQTYQNVELILTDDCSRDNTVDIARAWLDINGSRFVNIELVTTTENTGTSANLNRGIRKSKGEWVKGIAADDILIPSAINDYISFILSSNNKVMICATDVEPFSTEGIDLSKISKLWYTYYQYQREPYDKQWQRIQLTNVFIGPTLFFRRYLYDLVGGFSEEYGLGEEWPFVYNVLKEGFRIFVIEKKLVRYRVAYTSVCHSKDENGLGNPKLFESYYNFFFNTPYYELKRQHRYLELFDKYLYYKSMKYRYSSGDNLFSRILFTMSKIVSPYRYFRALKLIEY